MSQIRPEKPPMKSVFVLEHIHTYDDGEESWKKIGIYRTYSAAIDAIQRINKQPGFCDHPDLINHNNPECKNGFNIDEYELDLDHWTEGYVTIQG